MNAGVLSVVLSLVCKQGAAGPLAEGLAIRETFFTESPGSDYNGVYHKLLLLTDKKSCSTTLLELNSGPMTKEKNFGHRETAAVASGRTTPLLPLF